MPGYRDYNAKLANLRSMRRVTSTMKMVAATHLYRAQLDLKKQEDYAAAFHDLMRELFRPGRPVDRRLTEPRADVRNGLLLVLTSNRGLCGAFNANVIRAVQRWLAENSARFKILRASFGGRKGWLALRNRIEVRSHYESLTDRPDLSDAIRIGREMARAYLARKYDEVYIVYNRFQSPITQVPVVERLLPLAPPPPPADGERRDSEPEILLEPDDAGMTEQLVFAWIGGRVFEALLHNAASEHGARMTAMENANANINKMNELYTLLRNRARQAAITKELSEIVGGAEALKG